MDFLTFEAVVSATTLQISVCEVEVWVPLMLLLSQPTKVQDGQLYW
jgi:hypothetical protein